MSSVNKPFYLAPGISKGVVLLLILVLIGSPLSAQWIRSKYGIASPRINGLIYHNGQVYAGTAYDGVYRSDNLGTSWRASQEGLSELRTTALVESGSNVIAGTVAGVYLSSDDGATWTFSGLPATFVRDFLVVGSTIHAGTDLGLFTSADGGASWTPNNVPGLPKTTIVSLTRSGTTLFAGTSDGRLFRYTGVGPWTLSGLTATNIYAVEAFGDTLFASTNTGVFRSTDMGTTWANVLSYINTVQSFIVIGPRLFAGSLNGIWYSDDMGDSFQSVGFWDSGLKSYQITTLLAAGGYIFAGTLDYGVFSSADNGLTWSESADGMGRPPLAVLGGAGQTFYGASAYGVQVSHDWGSTWTSSTTGIPPGLFVNYLSVLGTTLFVSMYANNIYVSYDEGTTWIPNNTAITAASISRFVTAGPRLFVGSNNGLLVSDDNGTTWSLTALGSTPVYVNARDNQVYAATVNTIYSSSDYGVTWTTLGNTGPYEWIRSIELANGTPLVGTEEGLLTTADNGQSWFKLVPSLVKNRIFAMVRDAEEIFLSSPDGVFLYSNGSITDLSAGLPADHRVLALRLDSDTLYAAVNTPGYYGGMWKLPRSGFPVIAALSSYQGSVGDLVTILGQNFSTVPGKNIVYFNDQLATVVTATPTSLTVAVPSTYGNAKVKITVSGRAGLVYSAVDFAVIPKITGLDPPSGYQGSSVRILGTGFDPNISNLVKFNGVGAFSYGTTTSQSVVVPEYASSGTVTLAAGAQTISSPTPFVVLPRIIWFNPKKGGPATVVDIYGSGFSPVTSNNQVTVNGLPAQIIGSFKTTNLKIIMPSGVQTGVIKIQSGMNATQSAEPFVVQPFPSPCYEVPQQPTIQVIQVDTLGTVLVSSSAIGNQWYLNGQPIEDARDSVLVAPESGVYTVIVTLLGCASPESLAESVIVTGLENSNDRLIRVVPNPASDRVVLYLDGFLTGEPVHVILRNPLGQPVSEYCGEGGSALEVGISDLASGIYVVQVVSNSAVAEIRLIKR